MTIIPHALKRRTKSAASTISNYDAISSQFDLPKIFLLLSSLIGIFSPWALVTFAQTIAIVWLFKNQYRQSGRNLSANANEPYNLKDDIDFDRLSKRITLAQNHVNSLLARADHFDLGMTRIAEAETIIADLSQSASGQNLLLNNVVSNLNNEKIRIDKLSMTISNIITLTTHTDPTKLLGIILQKMDELADSTYGGSLSPLSNPTFLPNQADIIQFDSLASLAAAIARIQKLPLHIPSDAGLYWFFPSNPGVPQFSQDRHGDPTIQCIMRLRCDHHLIRQYVNAATPDHVKNDGPVQR